MIRSYLSNLGIAGLFFCVSICGAISEPQPAASTHALGPLNVGMSRKDVETLHFPFMSSTINLEGEDYIKDEVRISVDFVIVALFWNDKVVELTTKSSRYRTKQGGRVGDILERLRRIYPSGRISKGQEEGLYFTFDTGVDDQVFIFDAEKLGRDCIVNGKRCHEPLSKTKSISLSVR